MNNRYQGQYTNYQWQQIQQQQWQQMQQQQMQQAQYANPYGQQGQGLPQGYVKKSGCGCGRNITRK